MRDLRITALRYALGLLVALSLLMGSRAEARVTRVVIASRDVVADGMSFGASGPYEKLRGRVFFEVDPQDPRNAVVFDLDKASRNANGLVEFSADMMILKPVDVTLGNHELFFEVHNRGNKLSLILMNDTPPGANNNNPTTARDLGNGFLLRRGYTLAWVGWEADILPGNNRLTAQLPMATENGTSITELILTEFADARGAAEVVFTLPLSGTPTVTSYEATSVDQALAMAELRMRPSDSPQPPGPDIPAGEVIPTSQWSFARCPNGPPGVPSATDICLSGGFRNDMVYQLIYKAKNPTVMGLGYVTSRDFIAFLRHEIADDDGNPNPVPGITTALCQGISQTGQYVRDFIYQGFNEDERGGRVCDAAWIHVQGAPKLALNYRFAQPNPATLQHATRVKPDTNFPRTYALRKDPLTGGIDGILKRPATDPKVLHTVTSTEYWQFRASLVDTNEDGTVDLEQPDNVRRYLFSSTQHFPTKGGAPNRGIVDVDGNPQCQQFSNPTHNGALARALLVALDRWVRDGTEPPDSRVPRIDEETLVPSDSKSTRFPTIPAGPTWDAVTYNGVFNASGERDFGPRVHGNSGIIDNLIPVVLSEHRVLVPKVDKIGNEIAGIRHPFIEAPVATHTGWNLRTSEFTDGDLCGTLGMMIPLFDTKAARLAAGDPRPSLEELYKNHKGYVNAVAKAARKLARHRFLLEEDVEELIQEAEQSDVLK
jgi:Alpha/beta hydrolase domain